MSVRCGQKERDDAPPLAAHRWLLGLVVLLSVAVVWMSRAEASMQPRLLGTATGSGRPLEEFAQVMESLVNVALIAGALFAVSRVAGAAARLADPSRFYLDYVRWALAIASTAFVVTTGWVVITTAGSGSSLSAFHAAISSLKPGAIALLAGVVLLRRLPPLGGAVLTACTSASLALTTLL